MSKSCKLLLTSLWILLIPALGLATTMGEEVPRPLSDEIGDQISRDLKGANLFRFTVDLNVRVTIPAEENPYVDKDEDLWATVITSNKEERLPTILIVTPYRREIMQILGIPLLHHGYNLMVLDIRGTGSSGGQWGSLDLAEQYDLKYVIDEWIPSQTWSDGEIGMLGPSYMGITQLLAAGLVDRNEDGVPTHLKALFPMVAMSDAYKDIVVQGGNLDLAFIPAWLLGVDMLAVLPPLLYLGEDSPPDIGDIEEATYMWVEHLRNAIVPVSWVMDPSHETDGPFYYNKSPMIYWPVKPEGGWGFSEGDEHTIPEKLPVFLTGGWFDLFTRGEINNYQYGLSRHSDADKALIMGEWYHLGGSVGLGIPALESGELPARWFDWKIKGNNDCFMKDFPVLLYVMGENRWRAEKSWPLPESRVEKKRFYLSKRSATPIEDDWFTNEPNNQIYSLVENPSVYDFEGDDPVLNHSASALHGLISRSSTRWLMGVQALPSQVSKFILGCDMNDIMPFEDERYDDGKIPTFTTRPLEEDLEIVGPLSLTFWARTKFLDPDPDAAIYLGMIGDIIDSDSNLISDILNQKDVQWVVELEDVFPDGRARNITSGWLSARHRQYNPVEAAGVKEHPVDPAYTPFDPFYDGPDKDPRPINEGELYQYVVELWPTCNVFKEGHRIRVSISASDFPHFLPTIVPSENTIVINEDHPAILDFTAANRTDEGKTWKWIDNVNNYLMAHIDSPDTPVLEKDDNDEADTNTINSEGEGIVSDPIPLGANDSDSGLCFIDTSRVE